MGQCERKYFKHVSKVSFFPWIFENRIFSTKTCLHEGRSFGLALTEAVSFDSAADKFHVYLSCGAVGGLSFDPRRAVEQLLFFKLQLKEVKEVKINGFFQRLEKLKAARDFRFQYFVLRCPSLLRCLEDLRRAISVRRMCELLRHWRRFVGLVDFQINDLRNPMFLVGFLSNIIFSQELPRLKLSQSSIAMGT